MNSRPIYQSEHLLSDEEILKLGIEKKNVEQYRRKHYNESFTINSWYEKLKENTFLSIEMKLSFKNAKNIIKHHNSYINSGYKIIEKFEEDFEDLLNGIFIKLNTRSPKDVPQFEVESEKSQKIIDEELNKRKALMKDGKLDLNAISHAIIIATNKMMKVETGKDALELLIKSNRVFQDLSKSISFGEDFYQSKLILREWVDEVVNHPEMEFRCFVHEKQLNAITQYFHDTFFEELFEKDVQKTTQKRLVDFFHSKIEKFISQSSYVIDFFIGKEKIYLIEINPFHSGAGSGLFSWSHDRNVLFKGPLEFRFNQTKKKGDFSTIQMEKFLIKKYGFFDEIEGHEKYKKELKEKKSAIGYNSFLFSIFIVALTIAFYYYKKLNS
eukprot:gene8476-298_t